MGHEKNEYLFPTFVVTVEISCTDILSAALRVQLAVKKITPHTRTASQSTHQTLASQRPVSLDLYICCALHSQAISSALLIGVIVWLAIIATTSNFHHYRIDRRRKGYHNRRTEPRRDTYSQDNMPASSMYGQQLFAGAAQQVDADQRGMSDHAQLFARDVSVGPPRPLRSLFFEKAAQTASRRFFPLVEIPQI